MRSSSSRDSAGTPDAAESAVRASSSQSVTAPDYPDVTGVLLVGGSSGRFGSPKALARFEEETLAERAWRTLGEAFARRLALGKAEDALGLPFPVTNDDAATRAPLAGLVSALRRIETRVAVVVPVDMPLLDVPALHALADGCRDAAVPPTGPLPGAYARPSLAVLARRLERGELKLRDALRELDTSTVDLDPRVLVNVNEPADLERLRAAS